MNIFVLSEDPVEAARFACDKHVVKMCTESAQIISAALHLRGRDTSELYKPSHLHHPCVKWAADSVHNLDWLQVHGEALADEYYLRYGVRRGMQHGARAKVVHARKLFPADFGNFLRHTPFVQCMPEEYRSDNAVNSYRELYRRDKSRFAKWSAPAQTPDWW